MSTYFDQADIFQEHISFLYPKSMELQNFGRQVVSELSTLRSFGFSIKPVKLK